LYFQGAGGLRFEPTPAGSGGQDTAFLPSYTFPLLPANPVSPASGPTSAAGVPSSNASQPGGARGAKIQDLGGGSLTGHKHGGSAVPVGLLIAAVLGLVLVAPRSARYLIRRRRWLSAADDSRRAPAGGPELLAAPAANRIPTPARRAPPYPRPGRRVPTGPRRPRGRDVSAGARGERGSAADRAR